MRLWLVAAVVLVLGACVAPGQEPRQASGEQSSDKPAESMLSWSELPPLPDPIGVAGPFVGVHRDALIVAGGANFPHPVWENDKRWHDAIHVLIQKDSEYRWIDAGKLHRPVAYGAAVSTAEGVVCIGGNDAEETFADVFLLRFDPDKELVEIVDYPPLPQRCAYASAAIVGDVVYVVAGQHGLTLDTATNQVWALDLAKRAAPDEFAWQPIDPLPGPSRALHLTIAQHDGYAPALYVISGRRQQDEAVEFLRDVWQYTPSTNTWRRRADAPSCVMAGTGIDVGQSHLLVLGGADGSLFHQSDQLRDQHPGFPKQAWAYHTITDAWTSAGPTPANHVTTIAVRWNDAIVIPSGEIRPRVRSPKVWQVRVKPQAIEFGWINYGVLFGYLLGMVGVGAYFANKNKNTDDFFRGGKQVVWWAAGCSIFATMLSSLTYTGVPAKAFAQDWVYAVGNFMIPLVAFLAVYVALPFYRCIDATSAYEYLEKRFNRAVRLFASASFATFHVFRMAVVMSLTGLALAVATPLTPIQSVLLMGTLSILYCAMGGIEAVIWTDTIQTVVLLGGAVVALVMLVAGVDGGATGLVDQATRAGKFNIANAHFDVTSSQIALWVIIVGGIAQNISSYTADQAVVQRYMTTATQELAARSIWTNAVLTIPATFLFFGIGTALFAFYHSHPERLDPTITTDQMFPLFIAHEMPVGMTGLIVAGIFAAAQSTVSTSMNSTATTIVTDFVEPIGRFQNDRMMLWLARFLTVAIGIAGTWVGVMFVDPEIRSLFDQFIKVIGLFMGVLGGLFLLGTMTTRATGFGAMVGAVVGAAVMFGVWRYTAVNGYLYSAVGIVVCFLSGYLASLAGPATRRDLTGLTLHTRPNR